MLYRQVAKGASVAGYKARLSKQARGKGGLWQQEQESMNREGERAGKVSKGRALGAGNMAASAPGKVVSAREEGYNNPLAGSNQSAQRKRTTQKGNACNENGNGGVGQGRRGKGKVGSSVRWGYRRGRQSNGGGAGKGARTALCWAEAGNNVTATTWHNNNERTT